MSETKMNRKTPLVFRLGVGLLCAMLMTTHLTGNLYARYSATATGSDLARVAKFNINNSLSDQSNQPMIELNFYDPAKLTDSVTFQVTSSSEVAVKYDVVVTLPEGNDYTWLSITLSDESESGSVSGNVFTFSNVGTFTPNDENPRSHTLIFSIQDHQGKPYGGISDISGNVIITVHAEQID